MIVVETIKRIHDNWGRFAHSVVYIYIYIYIYGYGGMSESGLCVFPELCPVSFHVVGESSLVLL